MSDVVQRHSVVRDGGQGLGAGGQGYPSGVAGSLGGCLVGWLCKVRWWCGWEIGIQSGILCVVLGILPGIYFPWIEQRGNVNILLLPVDRYGCIEYLHVLKVSYI